MRRVLAILVLLGLAGAGTQSSGASFVSQSGGPGTTFRAVVDWVAPSVTIDAALAMRRAATLTATASDVGSVTSLRIQLRATGSTIWREVCEASRTPLSCSVDTTAYPDGSYDVRAVALDGAGNTGTTPPLTRIIDNTAPRPLDVQTTNAAGGTNGRAEKGDAIRFTFSEPVSPASVLAGWTAGTAPVSVTFADGNPDVVGLWSAAGTTRLGLGTVDTSKKFVTADATFADSTMSISGSTVTVVLGTPTSPVGYSATLPGTGSLTWTPLGTITDVAGNPLTTATITETGALDRDF